MQMNGGEHHHDNHEQHKQDEAHDKDEDNYDGYEAKKDVKRWILYSQIIENKWG